MRKSTIVVGIVVIFCISIFAVSGVAGQSTETYTGVAVEMSEVQQEDVFVFAEGAGSVSDLLPGELHAFYLYNPDSEGSKFVITNELPQTGTVTVDGHELEPEVGPEFPTPIIVATDVDVDTEGKPVKYNELLLNQREYMFEHIRIEAPYTQVAYSLDVAEGEFTNRQANGRFLPTNPSDAESHVLPVGKQTQWIARDIPTEHGDEDFDADLDAVESKLALSAPVLTQDYQSTRYWANAEATVDAAVLSDGARLTLHIADVSFNTESTDLESVADGQHDHDVVTVEGDRIGGKVSSKDALLEAARCAPDSVAFPVGGCVPVPTDSTVDSGVLYESDTEPVYYVGISNEELSQTVEPVSESATVTGRVVGASEIDPRLSGKAIVVYDVESSGSSSNPVTDELEDQGDRIQAVLHQQTTDLGEYEIDAESSAAVSAEEGGNGADEDQSTDREGDDETPESQLPTTDESTGTESTDGQQSTTESSTQRESSDDQQAAERRDESEPSTMLEIMTSRISTLSAGLWSPGAGVVYAFLGMSLWISMLTVRIFGVIHRRYDVGFAIYQPPTRSFVYSGAILLAVGGFILDAMGVVVLTVASVVAFETLRAFANVVDELFEGYYEGRK